MSAVALIYTHEWTDALFVGFLLVRERSGERHMNAGSFAWTNKGEPRSRDLSIELWTHSRVLYADRVYRRFVCV